MTVHKNVYFSDRKVFPYYQFRFIILTFRLFELPETQANIAYTEQIVSPIKPIKIPPLTLDRTKPPIN